MKKLLCTLLILSMGTMLVGCTKSDNSSQNSSSNKQEESSESGDKSEKGTLADRTITELKQEKSTLTYDDFKNMNLNQSYNEIKAAYGDANILVQNSESDTYTWKMENNKTISVVFKAGKAFSKSQGLLSEKKVSITKENYEKLSADMTFDEVKAIVGEGVFTNAEVMNDGNIKKWYSFQNEDGSSAILIFVGDKLYSLSNNNLVQ